MATKTSGSLNIRLGCSLGKETKPIRGAAEMLAPLGIQEGYIMTERTYQQTDVNALKGYAELARHILGVHWKVTYMDNGTLLIAGCAAKIECWATEDDCHEWASFDVLDFNNNKIGTFPELVKAIAVTMAHPDKLETNRGDIRSWVLFTQQIAATKVKTMDHARS
jgi:hypothetical protein